MVAVKRFVKAIVYVINGLLTLGIFGLFEGHDVAVLDYADLVINYLPKWLLLLPFSLLMLSLSPFTKFKTVVLSSVFLLFLWFQDFQLNIPNKVATSDFSVLTLNVGNGTKAASISALILQYRPDIVLLQESNELWMAKTFDDSWQTHCVSHLCVASRLNFKFEEQYSRKLFGGWGSFVSSYLFNIEGIPLEIINVHLETPRSLLMGAMYGYFDRDDMRSYRNTKAYQAKIISALLETSRFAIAAGDFNMTIFENSYKDNLAHLNNALNDTGFGFNYTKNTSWHGVRIDHVLSSSTLIPVRTVVKNTMGGDHKAILVEFSFLREG